MTGRGIPPWSIVTVPFPYIERDALKARPALAISTHDFQRATGLCWVLMITSALHDRWPGDILIEDARAAGLAKPSVVRTAKIAVAELRRLMPIGSLDLERRQDVVQAVTASLADVSRL